MSIRASILIFSMALAACVAPGTTLPPATMEEGDREMMGGNWLRAAQIYERVAHEQSKNSKVWQWSTYKACVCRLKMGQASNVLPKLQKLASSGGDPKLGVLVHDSLGETHRALGQYPECLRELQALTQIPRQLVEEMLKYDEVLFKLVGAYLRVGDRVSASATFKELSAKFPASLRLMDAALRMTVKGFAVRVGDSYPASEEKLPPPAAGGYTATFIKVDVKGQPAMLVAVVTVPSYEEAVRVADQLSRTGVKAEPLP